MRGRQPLKTQRVLWARLSKHPRLPVVDTQQLADGRLIMFATRNMLYTYYLRLFPIVLLYAPIVLLHHLS